MKVFVIFVVLIGLTVLVPQVLADCISLPCDDANTESKKQNYRFFDFPHLNLIGEPIRFILEKTAYDDCNSFNAKITDENGNLVWAESRQSLCSTNNRDNLVISYIKIGYNEDHPIIINGSGRYFITIEMDGESIQREFSVRRNHTGVSLDRTPLQMQYGLDAPLKQFRSGTSVLDINCNGNLVLILKHDGSPACVKPDTKQELIERDWANTTNVPLRHPVSSPPVQDPMSISINGTSTSSIIQIKQGETKEINILLEPKVPIISSNVSVKSYFGSSGDCKNIDTDTYCPGREIVINLSDTKIKSKKEITLTISIPENMTAGTFGYKIETETTLDSQSNGTQRTVGNSLRFDLVVQ